MKKLAAKRLLLDGCVAAVAFLGVTPAAAADVLIATPAEAHAFHDDAPFVFSGQTLSVDTSFSTDRAFSLATLAPVFVGEGVHFELNGAVSAQGAPVVAPLEKRGPGTLALLGPNTYTSNTVLREGALRVGGMSPFGHAINTFEQHAGTVLELESGMRLMNYAQITATRPGDVPLPGLEGRVEWRVPEGAATAVNNVNALMPLHKTGEGALVVSGTIMGMNSLHVDGGSVVLDGTMSGHVHVGDGGRLEGRGEFASARVAGGGTVAPGGREAVGTLFTWGDVAFEPGSVYHVNMQADGAADRLEILGKAQLDGLVRAEAGLGEWLPEQRYTILAAGGGFGDTRFADVDTNLAFLDPALEYDASRVYLTLRRNDLAPGDVGDGPDERDVGDVIDPPAPQEPPVEHEPPVRPEPTIAPEPPVQPETPGEDASAPVELEHPSGPVARQPELLPLTPLQRALVGMSREQARSALRQMTGSWHASVRSFMLEDSRYVRQAVLASAPEPGAFHVAGLRGWSHGYAAEGRRGAAQGVDADRHGAHGLVLGLDAPAGRHWRLGGVAAARQARLDRGTRGGPGHASASVQSLDAGLVAHGNGGGMRVTVGLLRAWHRIESRRRVWAGPLHDVLGATVSGRSWQAFMELAPRLRHWREWAGRLRNPAGEDSFRMAPWLQHAWVRLHVPGFQEAGGASAHRVEGATHDAHVTTLGWRARREFAWQGRRVGLQADLGWRHVWGNPEVTGSQRFVSGAPDTPGRQGTPEAPGIRAEQGGLSAPFVSRGQPLRRDALSVGLAVEAAPWRHARLSARYGGLFGSGLRDHAGWAELRWTF